MRKNAVTGDFDRAGLLWSVINIETQAPGEIRFGGLIEPYYALYNKPLIRETIAKGFTSPIL